LVCDQCEKGLANDFQKYDPDSKNYRFDVVLDRSGKPFVDGKEVSIERLEVMMKDEKYRHPKVCVRICVQYESAVKYEQRIVNAAHKAGIHFIRFNRVSIEEYMAQ
jgi:biopolymer transport protein ExbD